MEQVLNKLISTLSVYAQNQQGYHWNVVGKDFLDLHAFTEEVYDYAQEAIDMVAERVRQLQKTPVHTLEAFLEHSAIKTDKDVSASEDVMKHSLEQTEVLMKVLKEGIDAADDADDDGTEDMLIEILREVEKKAWMMRSWVN